MYHGSYKGVIKREAVYKCTNKDYLPEAKPRANTHFTCEAKPSKDKCIAHERSECTQSIYWPE